MGTITEAVRIEIPIETIDDTEPELSNLVKKLGKVGKAADDAGKSARKAGDRVSRFGRSAEKTQKSLAQWAKEKYEILLEAKERITPVLRTIGSGLRGFAGKTWGVTLKAVDLVTSPVRGILNLLKNPVFQAGAVLGVSIGMKDTVDTYKDFEAAMSQVSAVSGATGSDFDKLNAKAKEMGATTKFTATQAAEGFNYMAMAGWKTKDMLNGIDGILSLSAASGEDLGTTSDIVTDALTAFNLKAKDANHFADVLAQASANANTNVSMLGESFKYVAPVAGAMKYSVEDVSLALGLMANSSVKGSMSGTALKTSLANMASPTDKMEAAMKKYNISLKDGHGKMKTLKGVMDNLRSGLGGLSEAEQTAAASTIFGKEAMAGMLAIINASEKDYNKLTKAVNNADGASKDMADTMLDNLEGSITLFQSALDGVKLSLGERLSPYVRGVADWLTEMMPDVESALDDLMDFVDRKVDKLQAKFREISSTAEWADADFFGKVQIAWDEFIAEPFSEWWEGTGKAKIADALGGFGEVLGTGLHTGIMTLLGFDVSDSLNEGANIGKSFAKGFAEGFDFEEISSKLWEGFGNIVKNAGKLLPGGESADLSSLLSAAMLAKIASPLISAGSSVTSLASSVSGSGIGSLAGKALGSFSLEAEAAGIGGAAGTGLAGKLGSLGLSMGATTAAGSVAAGTVAAAGGVAGAAGLIHGGMDLYEGFTTDDEAKAAAYKKAGAIEVGGTAGGALAGAGAGAAIGAWFGGAGAVPGALIGAGVGAIGSWIAGNKVKEEYEENAKAAEEAAANADKVFRVTGQNIDDVTFKTKKLARAVNDTEVTAEEFAQMYQEAVVKNLNSHFGGISLSLSEIRQIAGDVVFAKQSGKLTEYSEAAEKASDSLSALKNSIGNVEKENWKVNLGLKLDESEQESYKSAIDTYAKNAKTYVENQHYEATLAIQLLAGKKRSSDMTGMLDETYTVMEKEISKLQKKLNRKTEKFLEDGIINADEQKAITKFQNKIQRFADKVAGAQEQASLNSLKVKFGGGALDSDSFSSLQEELAANTQSISGTYSDALESSMASLELMGLNHNSKKYKRLFKEIQDDYNSKIDKSNNRSENFQLDMIIDAYSSELDGILPDLKGTTRKKLKQAMSDALVIEPDVAKWGQGDVIKWFGLESLDEETKGAISTLLTMVAGTVPKEAKEIITNSFKDSIPSVKEIMEKVDFTSMSWDDFGKYSGKDFSGGFISDGSLGSTVLDGTEERFDELVKAKAEAIHSHLKEGLDPEELKQFMSDYMNSAVSDVDAEAADAAKEAGNAIGDTVIGGATSSIEGSTDLIRGALGNSIENATLDPFTPTVSINPDYVVKSFNASILSGDNNISGSETYVSKHAAGGYAATKQLSWLAEEGYGEYVIPTNPSRRARAIELYEQAGRALGVGAHAAGGYVSGAYDGVISPFTGRNDDNLNFISRALKSAPAAHNESTEWDYGEDQPVSYSPADSKAGNASGTSVQINVSVNPEFNISSSESQDEESVMAVIKRHMKELADDLGGEIAVRIEDVFSNMPMEGV